MSASDFGLIGLAVMGQNLARNIERNGYSVALYNRSATRVREFMDQFGADHRFHPSDTLADLVAHVRRPRKILMMIKAGTPVDELIDQLSPLLEEGDILIDGGNSYFDDTRRRGAALLAKGVSFVGCGISGGEEGALKGPSLMPGGTKNAYEAIEPAWVKIAAKTPDGPCTTYIGEDGAGHYVKMVHNGIEYGDMQLIAEAYDLLRTGLEMKPAQLAETFDRWNQGPLQSYLIEITAKIFAQLDPETHRPLVDLILDKAGQKGTGRWTITSALELGVATPTLCAAVEARILSSYKDQRVEASKAFPDGKTEPLSDEEREGFVDAVRDALYASKICAYAQGMALIQTAGVHYGWTLNLGELSRIWKGGCIIRARMLDDIKEAYGRRADLPNLMIDPAFKDSLLGSLGPWRAVVRTAHRLGVPVLAMGSALSYFDFYRTERSPLNLTQAQRDFFGAHTYERIDRPGEGPFHTEWE